MHASKLDFQFNLAPLQHTVLGPHQRYKKIQKYARSLYGWPCPSETQTVSNSSDFIDQLPRTLVNQEEPIVLMLDLVADDVAMPVLPAHVDLNRTCAINVYLESNGEVTKFYDWDRSKRISILKDSICTQEKDVWLMDTTVPHSVDLVPNKRRRILTFSFTRMKYMEVLSCFTTKQSEKLM